MATSPLTSSVEGIDLGSGLKIGTLLFLRTVFVFEIVEVSVAAKFIVTTDIDDVLMVRVTADEMSTNYSFRRDRERAD